MRRERRRAPGCRPRRARRRAAASRRNRGPPAPRRPAQRRPPGDRGEGHRPARPAPRRRRGLRRGASAAAVGHLVIVPRGLRPSAGGAEGPRRCGRRRARGQRLGGMSKWQGRGIAEAGPRSDETQRRTARGAARTYADLPRLMTLMTGDENTGPAPPRRLMCCGCCMTRCCGSRRTGWMTRAATGSCCPRGMGGRLLRGAGGQGLHPGIVATGVRLGWVAAGIPPGPEPDPGSGDRQRVARARAAARGGPRARADRSRAGRAAGVRAGR